MLQRLIEERGAPTHLRTDNGSEFIARTLAVFLETVGTSSYFIKPGAPWQNGFIESFNSRLRAERLDVEAFYNLADAKVRFAEYRRYYNEERPHSSLGYAAPAARLAGEPRSSSSLWLRMAYRMGVDQRVESRAITVRKDEGLPSSPADVGATLGILTATVSVLAGCCARA